MLKNTGSHFEKIPDMANGVFEHIPFRNEEFDAVLCGYSLRDAINLRIAISTILSLLILVPVVSKSKKQSGLAS